MIKIVVYNVEEKNKVIYNLGVLMEKKVCISQKNIGLLCEPSEVASIDRILWTFSSNYFIPHDIFIVNNEHTDYEDKNENQPVLLATHISNIINRDTICVLTEENLMVVLKTLTDGKIVGSDRDIELIYISYNIKNIDDIKLRIFKKKKKKDVVVDYYVQKNGKWQQDKVC